MVPTSTDLLARVAALPAGARLLEALGASPPPAGVWLVGGAVRDLALGRGPGELDLVVVGDAAAVAAELARRTGGALRGHDAFGTHTVDADGLRIDIAMARTESYPRPGALPVVEPAPSVEADLLRRDVTVNAIALGLSEDVRGETAAVADAWDDLSAERLRVLHERSFLDDPTRLLRLVRYAARLAFAIGPGTEALARAAFAAGAPATAGVARMGNELMLLLGEELEVAIAGLELLDDLGGWAGLTVDPPLLRAAAALLPSDGGSRGELLLLAGLGWPLGGDAFAELLDRMHVASPGPALDAASDPEALAAAMAAAAAPSSLHRLLRRRSAEAVALAGALGAEEPARRWLEDLRHRRLEIGGADLVRAGVVPGPEVGRRLDAALARKLDEGLSGREAELAAALEAE